ncbi:MAG: 2OG-Fe(II) oxygenase [Spongiibacteraceae bacterium]|jgi:SM-20-related protein
MSQLVQAPLLEAHNSGFGKDEHFFELMAKNIYQKGYSIHPNVLSVAFVTDLYRQLQDMAGGQFKQAGVGRENTHTINNFVRTDEICWISGESAAGRDWLCWAAALQAYLNRHLMLGLFSFESHFAHYSPGDFYKKHLDAFKGEANRTLSLVVYLNPDWQPEEGGELVLYAEDGQHPIRVTPGFGTVVAFLSEEFPHEVLPTKRDRYSIAGWFRVNGSIDGRIDPPR